MLQNCLHTPKLFKGSVSRDRVLEYHEKTEGSQGECRGDEELSLGSFTLRVFNDYEETSVLVTGRENDGTEMLGRRR